MLSNLLNGVIRFSLQQRLVVVVLAVFLLAYGGWQITKLPIDVFPHLDRPRVVVMTEAPGYAPEEVEAIITFPLESVLNGATGVQAVRTSSGNGLSVVYVEFDWGTDIFSDRQIVTERLALAADRMPPGVTPQLAPISSVMGQIMIIGMWSEDAATSPMQAPHTGRLGGASEAADHSWRLAGVCDGGGSQAVSSTCRSGQTAPLRRDAPRGEDRAG